MRGEGGVQASKEVGSGRTDSTLAGGGGGYDAMLSYFSEICTVQLTKTDGHSHPTKGIYHLVFI